MPVKVGEFCKASPAHKQGPNSRNNSSKTISFLKGRKLHRVKKFERFRALHRDEIV